MRLELTPITLSEANGFVARLHRTHKPVVGQKFSIAVSVLQEDDYDGGVITYGKYGEVVGVIIVGRPVSRGLDNGWTVEALRCCTDGTKNACSMLYGAAWRASKAMGYRKLVTYTLPSEGGASLRAAGWRIVGETSGGNWNCKARPRIDTEHQQQKLRWEAA